MRNSYTRRGSVRHSSSSESIFSNQWILIAIAAIIAIFLGFKIFGNSAAPETSASTDFISLTPSSATSAVYITPANGSRKQITETGKYFVTDSGATIEAGTATGSIRGSDLDFDENTDITYKVANSTENQTTNDTIKLNRGRVWVDSSSNNLFVELNNFTAKIPSGSVAIFEQTNVVNSAAYAISGNIEIITEIGQQTIKPGEKILVRPSDIKSTSTQLSELVGPSDSSIATLKIFTRNNGEEIMKEALAKSKEEANTEINSSATATGETLSDSTATGTMNAKYISFTQPIDGATLKTQTTTIIGTLLSTDVSRVTLNDVEAVVSPVNENFTMENFKLTAGTNNVVYKVYDISGTELERGVLVIYGPNSVPTANTIVPENFPNLKDFVITAPAANPYATTEDYVKVQWVVPKNTVKYITVNGYRLQKFVANSTTWYYHANANIGTIKEGTNLYHIKFYDANDKLIHTQIFTIIKDSKNATTTTATSAESPLFPAAQ